MSKGQLLAATAEAARWSGEPDRALRAHPRGHRRRPNATGETDRLGELHERLATYLLEAGKRVESWQAFKQAAALLADSPASAVKARVLAGIALGHLQAGPYADGAASWPTRRWRWPSTVGALAEEGRALNISGLALSMQGKPGAPKSGSDVRWRSPGRSTTSRISFGRTGIWAWSWNMPAGCGKPRT